MKLSRIRIKNYRDVEVLDLRLDKNHASAEPDNAERKNLIEAAELILGETWPLDRSFSEEYFYKYDTRRDLIIQVYFDEEIEEWRYRYLCKISGFELRVRAAAHTKENRGKALPLPGNGICKRRTARRFRRVWGAPRAMEKSLAFVS